MNYLWCITYGVNHLRFVRRGGTKHITLNGQNISPNGQKLSPNGQNISSNGQKYPNGAKYNPYIYMQSTVLTTYIGKYTVSV